MVCPITQGNHKNQDNPIKTVGRDSFLSPKTPKNTKMAEKNSAQTNRQTEKPTDTTKIMVTWP